MKIVMSNPAGTAPCSEEVPITTNRIDAFTNLINEWIDTNGKVFHTKGEQQ